MLLIFSSFAHHECFADEKRKGLYFSFRQQLYFVEWYDEGAMSAKPSDNHIDKIEFINSSLFSSPQLSTVIDTKEIK